MMYSLNWIKILLTISVVLFFLSIYGCEKEKPVSLLLVNPPPGMSVVYGEEIIFEAFDDELNEIPVIWASDVDGQIGIGSRSKQARLSVGVHTISATVTDKNGNTAVESVSITIEKPLLAAYSLKNNKLSPRTCMIQLKDGREIESSSCWEEGDMIYYYKYGTAIGISKSTVTSHSIKTENPSDV